MEEEDAFLKIVEIEGETLDKKHPNEIEVLSWSFGVTNPGTRHHGPGGGKAKSIFNDVSISKRADKATAKLMLACANGQHIKEAVLTVRKAGKDQQDYLVVTLTDCLISSFQASGPHESMSINYAKVRWAYKSQNADGTLGKEIATEYNIPEHA